MISDPAKNAERRNELPFEKPEKTLFFRNEQSFAQNH
jgi:hypothetical protein